MVINPTERQPTIQKKVSNTNLDITEIATLNKDREEALKQRDEALDNMEEERNQELNATVNIRKRKGKELELI